MSEMNEKLHQKVQQAIDSIERESTDPRILITGATGVGKSSLVNCIFGKKLQAVNTIASTTRSFTTHPYEIENGTTVYITDSPGYGEIGYDEQYSRDIVTEAGQSHVVSLVLKADEKGYDRDLKIIGMAGRDPRFALEKPLLIALTQIDKLEPCVNGHHHILSMPLLPPTIPRSSETSRRRLAWCAVSSQTSSRIEG
jgi:predicted GTPase